MFDLDGTLIHSTIDFVEMYRGTFALMREAGVPVSCLDMTKSISTNLTASYNYLTEMKRGDDATALLSDAGRVMSEIEMRRVTDTRAVKGVGGTIDLLTEKGYLVTILTRGSRRYTVAALKAAGLKDRFPRYVCRDDHPDEEAKPNPISMIRAASTMRLRKEECVLVGDHAMDLECALSAGTRFVGVLSGATDMTGWGRLGDPMVIPDVSYLPDLLMNELWHSYIGKLIWMRRLRSLMMKNVRTSNAPVPVGPYSQAIICDKMVFCSGQLGIDPSSGKLVSSGTVDEAKQSLKNIRSVLEAAGTTMQKVVKVTIYMTDLDRFKDVNAIYAESFTEPFPARTTVGVARLPLGATIEIEVVAAL